MHDHELTKNALVKGQVLFVCGISEDSAEGGTWMSELAVPYTVFKARDAAMEQLRRSVPLAALTQPATFYSCIYLVAAGPRTTQWDLPGAHTLRSLLSDAAASGTLLLANRHGGEYDDHSPILPTTATTTTTTQGESDDHSPILPTTTTATTTTQGETDDHAPILPTTATATTTDTEWVPPRGESVDHSPNLTTTATATTTTQGESDDDETPLIAFDKEHGVMSGANLSSVEALAERAVAELLAGKHPSASVHVPTSSKPTLTGAEVGRTKGQWGTTGVGRPRATSPKGPATADTEGSAQLATPAALEFDPRMTGGDVGAGGAGGETSDSSNSRAGLATVPGVSGNECDDEASASDGQCELGQAVGRMGMD
ncbi:hypothetical protein FOA52_009308 [Chlamydomonas sp. UWO 241]|nr:hypothetical protein FOA52_009308 [Chlamydomonas sp. UWO 241]